MKIFVLNSATDDLEAKKNRETGSFFVLFGVKKVLYNTGCTCDKVNSDKEICVGKESNMKNIRLVLLGELLLFLGIFVFNVLMGGWGLSAILWFLDLPSLLLIAVVLIPGLLIMGAWKDFTRAFSVGIKPFSLLQLKNIIEAVDAAQKLTVCGALFAIIISGVLLLGRLDDPYTIGPNLAVCFLSGLYAVIIEFLLLPLRLNAERRMNEEMDMGE